MDINVKVKFDSPELIAALAAIAEALPQMQLGNVLLAKEVQTAEVNESESKTEKEESTKEEIIKIDLEDVREKLASLSQSGKQAQVKALITKFGAKKLTDIDSACYEELLKEAEVL
jgi:hypothetical protein